MVPLEAYRILTRDLDDDAVHYVRSGHGVSLGWLLWELRDQFTACDLYRWWLSLDVVAVKRTRRGGFPSHGHKYGVDLAPLSWKQEVVDSLDAYCAEHGALYAGVWGCR